MRAAGIAVESPAGLIIRELDPVNLESPFDQLNDFLTPIEMFYVRSHFKAPLLQRENYQLRIDGAVQTPLCFSYSELRAMPATKRAVTIECAGNGRVFLSPHVPGAQWQLGAVGTAEWTGVRLSDLLERAGLSEGAREIVFEAADRGTAREEPMPPGEISYARSIAVEKAGDVLLAYAMNGEDIPVDHGFPVRAIVPGHYGMASVKWLTRMTAVVEPFQGYWQTSDYAFWDEAAANPVRRPLGTMALKSSIARPRMRELIPAGQTYHVFGAAWSGASIPQRIDVSTDDGVTWREARFLDPASPFVWRRWEFDWLVPQRAGSYLLKSRAGDAAGHAQPAEHDKHLGNYGIQHTVGIEVVVR